MWRQKGGTVGKGFFIFNPLFLKTWIRVYLITEPRMYFKSSSQMLIIHSSSRVYVLGFALLVKEKEEQKMNVCGCKKEIDALGGQRTSWEGVMCRATH